MRGAHKTRGPGAAAISHDDALVEAAGTNALVVERETKTDDEAFTAVST